MIYAHIFHLYMPFWRNYALSQNIRLYFVERKSFSFISWRKETYLCGMWCHDHFLNCLCIYNCTPICLKVRSLTPYFFLCLLIFLPLSSPPSSFSISPTSYSYFSLPSSSSSYYSLDLGVFFLLWEWLRFFILMFDYSIVFSKYLIF